VERIDALTGGGVYMRVMPLCTGNVPRGVSGTMDRTVYFDSFREVMELEIQGPVTVRHRRLFIRTPFRGAHQSLVKMADGVWARDGFQDVSNNTGSQEWAAGLFTRPTVSGLFMDGLKGEGLTVVEDTSKSYTADSKPLLKKLRFSNRISSRMVYKEGNMGYGPELESSTPNFWVVDLIKVGACEEFDFSKGKSRKAMGKIEGLVSITDRGYLYFRAPKV